MLESAALARVARHAFTTRHLEPASPSDDSDRGWRELADALGVDVAAVWRLRQVHGNAVFHARAASGHAPFTELPEADIVTTDDPASVVTVRAADCVPILLADARSGAVAAAHAGWRGTAARVAERAVDALVERYGTDRAHVVAAIGPSIGPCCYEVRDDVPEAFAAAGHSRLVLDGWFSPTGPGTWRLDLWRATRDQLQEAGVPSTAVHACGLCTVSANDLFYSYRAEGERAGRLVAAIRVKRGTRGRAEG